mmetsp:Transcript_9579/g.25602  ORF Transcript_9579/g.25602 Transcript_9579/m.25602 type:complete len:228 (-) Transcript_9579:535-1218(-)
MYLHNSMRSLSTAAFAASGAHLRGARRSAAVVRSGVNGGSAICTFGAVTARSARVGVIRRGVLMRMGGGNYGDPSALQRAAACAVYLVPLLDSLSFGRYVFTKVPIVADVLLLPLAPVLAIYRGIPFFAFGVFLALYILVVRNTELPRFVRFNTQQALTLDIALIIPQLFSAFGQGVPPQIAENLSTSLFYAMLLAVGYAISSNVRGITPNQIPVISDSVEAQIGPF